MNTDALAAIRGVAEVMKAEGDLKAATLFWAIESIEKDTEYLRLRAQNAEHLLRSQLQEAVG